MTEEQRVQRFVDSQEWIFARTMADIPHWYCLKRNCSSPDEWDWFVHYMEDYGICGQFYGKTYQYLYLGEYRYWMMDPTPEECDLINRCLIKPATGTN